ncbi:MAG: hypothetical protein Q9214_000810 [Letrouitia sp. 1 TL-2023]
MSHNYIKRPVLGQREDLGALYDARTDSFVGRFLLNGPLPETTVSVVGNSTSQLQLISSDTYKERFTNLSIGTELGVSFLSGMVDVAGAAEYLKDERSSALIEQASIHYAITTAEETLGFGNPELTTYITPNSIQSSGATHVLADIGWGAQTIVTAKCLALQSNDRTRFENYINHEFSRVEHIIRTGGQDRLLSEKPNQTGSISPDVTVYSDVLDEPGHAPDLRTATDFLLELPTRTAALNEGKGMPLNYTLVPLELLKYTLNVEIKADALFVPPSLNYLEGFATFFDELHDTQQKLCDCYSEISKNRSCVPQAFIESVMHCVNGSKAAEKSLQSDLGRYLQAVRSNMANQSELRQLLEGAREKASSSEEITDMTKQYKDKIAFVNTVTASGINYIGYGAELIETQLRRNNIEDAYVLFFTESIRLSSESWHENYKFFQELRKKSAPSMVIAMADCDAIGKIIENAHVSRYQDGKLVVEDVLNQVKYGKCYVRYIDEEELDKGDAKKPLRRSAVKIACPGPKCDWSVIQDWVCQICNAPIEYGAADQYVYCDCGRSTYGNYGFKCKELEHGPFFERYEKGMLLQMLNSLDPMDELNILIIGETGVGKSTFINAFINYLSYDTLDGAINNDSLDWVIPCSFNYQTMDRSDPNGTIVQRKIQVGQDQDEADGAGGESATQRTMVYPVTLGDTVIRLIDTPGIGDTRGVEKDKENMSNILGMLSNFDKLHGILFLLKSNSSRLTLMFRFVMEELLTHLHRDATLNMVFGFTNTRISNYMPGDTYTPLDNLLKRHARVDIGLSPRTVYCFDSESFRFLAAEKMGLTMDNIQDFRLSWEKSERETKRLIEHFRSLTPHAVRSTLSLNQTRALILHLTKPMADIMQTIDKTIQLNIDNMDELKDTRLRGDQLQGRLHWERIELVHHSLEHPRTVCNDVDCKEYRDDGNGIKQTIYKSHCHPRCWLTGVDVGVVSCSALMNCAAFDGKENCTECGHHWENHLHVRHELEECTKTVQDEAIVEQLAKNASDIILKETAIQNVKKKIEESDYEYKEIQNAAVKFGVFLQKHSITPYNDAMEEYLNHLIKEEKGKVFAGGRQDRLENLERHLSEHVEQRKVLKDNISGGSTDELLDEAGVEDLVDHLYRLKHWGKNLRDIKNNAEADFLAEYREKPYRPGKNSRYSHSTRRMAGPLNWIAGMVPGSAMTLSRKMSTRVAAPYQPRNSAIQRRPRPPVPRVPGGYPEYEPNSAALAATQTQMGPLTRRLQAPEQPLIPVTEDMRYSAAVPKQRKGTSFTQKWLRPFTKRY